MFHLLLKLFSSFSFLCCIFKFKFHPRRNKVQFPGGGLVALVTLFTIYLPFLSSKNSPELFIFSGPNYHKSHRSHLHTFIPVCLWHQGKAFIIISFLLWTPTWPTNIYGYTRNIPLVAAYYYLQEDRRRMCAAETLFRQIRINVHLRFVDARSKER